jgi:hypothetical protein
MVSDNLLMDLMERKAREGLTHNPKVDAAIFFEESGYCVNICSQY